MNLNVIFFVLLNVFNFILGQFQQIPDAGYLAQRKDAHLRDWQPLQQPPTRRTGSMDAIIPKVLRNLLLDRFIKPGLPEKRIDSLPENSRTQNSSQTFDRRKAVSSLGRLLTLLGRSIKDEITRSRNSHFVAQNIAVAESPHRTQNLSATDQRTARAEVAPIIYNTSSNAQIGFLPPPASLPLAGPSSKKDYNWIPKWFPLQVSPTIGPAYPIEATVPTPDQQTTDAALAYQLVPLPCQENLSTGNAIVNSNGTFVNIHNGSIIGCGSCKWLLIQQPQNQGEGSTISETGIGEVTTEEVTTEATTESTTEATTEATTTFAIFPTTEYFGQQTFPEFPSSQQPVCCMLRLCCSNKPK